MPDLSITERGRLLNSTNADASTRLQRACTQFEQVFAELLMKRDDQDENPLLDGDTAAKQFRDLMNSGLSEQVAGHLGISDMLMRELGARTSVNDAAQKIPPTSPTSRITP